MVTNAEVAIGVGGLLTFYVAPFLPGRWANYVLSFTGLGAWIWFLLR